VWVRRHLDILRVGAAAVAALVLLLAGVDWVGFLIVVALLALCELGLSRLGRVPA
jgi:hypothetical protein